MDQEVARTLGELERKLSELERTLGEIGRGGSEQRANEPLGARLDEHASASSNTATPVPLSAPDPAAPTVPEAAADTSPLPPGSRGRIVDETVESARRQPLSPAWPGRAPQPPPTPKPIATARTAGTETRAFAPSAPDAHTTPPGDRRARSPHPPRSTSEVELLRFRGRLEQTARELAHDYDELLGRLSFASMPVASSTPTISFARGAPSLDIIDVDGLREAAVRAFDSDPQGTTAYGTSIGYPRLRSWIADRHGVEPERVLVTNGSMQADAFLFEHLVRPGDGVIVERPSYDRTLLSLRQRGAQLHDIELQPDGIDTNALGDLLAAGAARPRLAHIIPNFQNPAGYTLSLPKRHALLTLAAEHGFLVFEDDPYVELRFGGDKVSTMLSLDPERVVYASSFSKTVCPGIRVGYLVGPPQEISAIAQLATNTYISPNMVAQSIVYEFCASGAIDRSIETVRAALSERAQTLADALHRELPEAEFVPPQGGYFMWITLPAGTDVARLYTLAGERGVSFVKGTDFMLSGGENTLRLAYSGVTPEQIDAGVARLAEAYRSL